MVQIEDTAVPVAASVSVSMVTTTRSSAATKSVDRTIDHLQRLAYLLLLCLIFTWARIYERVKMEGATRDYYAASNVALDRDPILKILYIVTTSTEYNYGQKKRQLGKDRLINIVLPVLLDSVESMIAKGYAVDLFIVAGYNVTKEKEQMLLDLLPKGTGLEVWSDACPYDYDSNGRRGLTFHNTISQVTRALARQHRYVVKDKLFHYDLFLAFEDDIRITGEHINHYLWMNAELDRLRRTAPDTLPYDTSIFGAMTKAQLKRFKSGFIRVEVLIDEINHPMQKFEDPIPIDLDFTDINVTDRSLDPTICCHTTHVGLPGVPKKPNASSLMIWESGIFGFSLRELPPSSPLGWVGLLIGPTTVAINERFGKFTGNGSRVGNGDARLLAQSAGWMLTRKEILDYHGELCEGSFLPPFDTPTFQHDGLFLNNVEYWSGGLQMWCTKNGCNVQRVISLDPANFSKHLLYHTTNNKQITIDKHRRVSATTLLGQLNTYRKLAAVEKLNTIAASAKKSSIFSRLA